MQDFGSKSSTPREPDTYRISVGGGVCGPRLIEHLLIDTPNKWKMLGGLYAVLQASRGAGSALAQPRRAGAADYGGRLVAAAAVSTTDSIAAA